MWSHTRRHRQTAFVVLTRLAGASALHPFLSLSSGDTVSRLRALCAQLRSLGDLDHAVVERTKTDYSTILQLEEGTAVFCLFLIAADPCPRPQLVGVSRNEAAVRQQEQRGTEKHDREGGGEKEPRGHHSTDTRKHTAADASSSFLYHAASVAALKRAAQRGEGDSCIEEREAKGDHRSTQPTRGLSSGTAAPPRRRQKSWQAFSLRA